jgi:hypothetical protein
MFFFHHADRGMACPTGMSSFGWCGGVQVVTEAGGGAGGLLRGREEPQGAYHGCPFHEIMRCSLSPTEAHSGCTRGSHPSVVVSS